jgi:hypothetical protein
VQPPPACAHTGGAFIIVQSVRIVQYGEDCCTGGLRIEGPDEYVEIFGTHLAIGRITPQPNGEMTTGDTIGGSEMTDTFYGWGNWDGLAGVVCMGPAMQSRLARAMHGAYPYDETHPAGELALNLLSTASDRLHTYVDYSWRDCCKGARSRTRIHHNIP